MIPMPVTVGAPYAYPSRPPETFDCWSLVVHVRAAVGLRTPLSVSESDFDPRNFGQAVARELVDGDWVDTSKPTDGDLVVFSSQHVGVWFGGRVVHAASSCGVQVATWRSVRRRYPGAHVMTLQ